MSDYTPDTPNPLPISVGLTDTDDAAFAELEMAAYALVALRNHTTSADIRARIDEDAALADQFDAAMNEAAKSDIQSSWSSRSVMFYEVTPAPDTDVVLNGVSYAVINQFRFSPILISFGKSEGESS